jgi:hypothetical protein
MAALQRAMAKAFEQAEAAEPDQARDCIVSAKARVVSHLAADHAARAWGHLLDHRGCAGSA